MLLYYCVTNKVLLFYSVTSVTVWYRVTLLLSYRCQIYAIALPYCCVPNVTLCSSITLSLCSQCYYMVQYYPVTVLLVLLYSVVLLCYCVTSVTTWRSFTLLLSYQCYYIVKCYLDTVILVLLNNVALSCYCVGSVTIFYSFTMLL